MHDGIDFYFFLNEGGGGGDQERCQWPLGRMLGETIKVKNVVFGARWGTIKDIMNNKGAK
jgi:hypothetical protein